MATIKYGDFETEVEKLPGESIAALMQEGVTHYMGNRCASKLAAAKKKAEDAGKPMSDDEAEAFIQAARQETWQRILDGKLAVRVSGPRGRKTDTVFYEVAAEMLLATPAAKAGKITLPAKADARREYIDGICAKHEAFKAKVDAEVARRAQATEVAEDLDLD